MGRSVASVNPIVPPRVSAVVSTCGRISADTSILCETSSGLEGDVGSALDRDFDSDAGDCGGAEGGLLLVLCRLGWRRRRQRKGESSKGAESLHEAPPRMVTVLGLHVV